jgi:Rps23 Pro-64 3,4-dihydroxylase Tpa1-like proline 4-hydroxylase
MSLSISRIRRIIERHPLPDKRLNDILQQWMIELAEELADNLLENVEASEKLASKEDIKQLIELSNTRFESLRQEMNAHFEAQQKETNALRQEMNARFESMEKANAARFEALQKQIDGVQRQIAFMQWWFSIGGGITLLLIILKLFFPHIFPH